MSVSYERGEERTVDVHAALREVTQRLTLLPRSPAPSLLSMLAARFSGLGPTAGTGFVFFCRRLPA